jgi:hypothetical protein
MSRTGFRYRHNRLINELITLLPARFKFRALKNMPEDEAIEMIFKYSRLFFFNPKISQFILWQRRIG